MTRLELKDAIMAPNRSTSKVLEMQSSTAQGPSFELKIKSKHGRTTIGLNGNGKSHHSTGLIKNHSLHLFSDLPLLS